MCETGQPSSGLAERSGQAAHSSFTARIFAMEAQAIGDRDFKVFRNRPMLRIFLKRQLNRSDLSAEHKMLVRSALLDQDVMDAALLELDSRPDAKADGMPFLDWLIENADEILALIIKIIGLF